jgi:hypothetical protein
MIILKNKGIATLPTMIVLGMMVLAVVVSITSLTFSGLMISQGQSQSSSALFYAEAGARDALVKIARNTDYTCVSTDCYSVDFITNGCTNNTDCAKVQVTGNRTTKVITSKGIMKASTRTMQVTVTLDGATNDYGLIQSAVWLEI